jgi:hypothetical protein
MRRLLVFAVFGCCSCGGTEAVEGTYEVTAHVESGDDCGTLLEPAAAPETFFKIAKDSFFGQELMAYYSCTSATACDESIDIKRSAFEENDGAWIGDYEFSVGSWTGDPPNVDCTVTAALVTMAEEGAGVKLRVEMGRLERTISNEDDCDGDLLRANRDEVVCQSIEEITGKRVD